MTPAVPRSRRWLRVVLVSAALAGAGVSFFLQVASVAGRAGMLFAQMCGAGERFDCSSALAGPWGRIGPLPTATWGFAYFSFLALWYVIAGLPNRAGRRRHLIPVVVALAGGAASLFYTYVLLVRLPTLCPWCLAVHGLNAVVLIGTLWAWPRGDAALLDPPRPSWPRVAGVIGIGAAWTLATVAFLTAWYYSLAAGTARGALLEAVNNPDYIVWRHDSQRPVELPSRNDDFSVGPAAAPHTLVAFLDFECPHCREFEEFVPDLLRRYPGRLRVVFKHYPMSRACSPLIPPQQDVHRFSCEAARAAGAARQVGTPQQAWQYRKLLFAGTESLAQRSWVAWASAVGIDAARFREAMEHPDTAARVAADVAVARSLDVQGAGAMFLDGRRLTAWRVTTPDVRPRTDDVQTWRLWDRLLPEALAPMGNSE